VNLIYVDEVLPDPVTQGNYLITMRNSTTRILLSRNNYDEFLVRQRELKTGLPAIGV
jgi:hypothetical protein